MTASRQGPGIRQANPVTRASFRRQVWFQIYLPLIVIVLVVAVLTVALWRSAIGTASAWADAALVTLLAPWLLLTLIPLALLGVTLYGVGRLIGALPPLTYRLQRLIFRISTRSDRVLDEIVKPVVVVNSGWAAARHAVRTLRSRLRR